MTSINFQPAGDANGVFVCIPEADAQVYVEAGFSTDDPLVVAALDANPAVARAPKGTSAGSTTEKES